MITTTDTAITAAARRSRPLVTGDASWRADTASTCAPATNGMRDESAFASIHSARLTDVVPAPQAGRGSNATKQTRPPRGDPR